MTTKHTPGPQATLARCIVRAEDDKALAKERGDKKAVRSYGRRAKGLRLELRAAIAKAEGLGHA